MQLVERATKIAAVVSVLLIVGLQITVNSDATPGLRSFATFAFLGGWLGARSARGPGPALWIFLAPFAPVAVRTLAMRLGPVADLVWMAGFAGALLPQLQWSRWSLPPGWRPLAGGWAFTLALAWPILIGREIGFNLNGFFDFGAINSWSLLSAPQVAGWILHVVLTQLLAILFFDWLSMADRASARAKEICATAFWLGSTIASVVAIYQGTVDLAFLSTEYWVGLRRATGTFLDANALGIAAAIAGPLAYTVIRERRWPAAWLISTAALAVNVGAMWLSGSRTALLCGLVALIALLIASRRSGVRVGPREISIALATSAAIAVLVLLTPAIGPARRLLETPGTVRDGLSWLWNRGGYGTVAMDVVREYPLSGVGVGAFYIFAPDYWRAHGNVLLPSDNAQNWWRHQAAELGVIGGISVFALSAAIVWCVLAARARREAFARAYVARGLLVGIGLSSLLGMPTQNPIVLLAFMFVLAWFLGTLTNPDLAIITRYARGAWVIVAVAAVVYALLQLRLSLGSLDVGARAIRWQRPYVAGTFPPEQLPDFTQFRWTSEKARFVLPAPTRLLLVRIWAHHPDITTRPVRVVLSTSCGILLDQSLRTHEPIDVAIELPAGQAAVDASLRVSHTWRPAAYGLHDGRELGAAVSTVFVPSDVARSLSPTVRLTPCSG